MSVLLRRFKQEVMRVLAKHYYRERPEEAWLGITQKDGTLVFSTDAPTEPWNPLRIEEVDARFGSASETKGEALSAISSSDLDQEEDDDSDELELPAFEIPKKS